MEKWRTSKSKPTKTTKMVFQLSKNYSLNKKKNLKTITPKNGKNSDNNTPKTNTMKLNVE